MKFLYYVVQMCLVQLCSSLTKFIIAYYQMREKSLWDKIESTFKQIDTAGTELECFQVLQKQEQLAASLRVGNLWEVVQKQKELERTLQSRYGSLLAELERTKQLIEGYRAEAKRKEEAEAKNDALIIDNAASEAVADSLTDEENSSGADVSQEMDSTTSLKPGINADSLNEDKTEDVNQPDEEMPSVEGEHVAAEQDDIKTPTQTSAMDSDKNHVASE